MSATRVRGWWLLVLFGVLALLSLALWYGMQPPIAADFTRHLQAAAKGNRDRVGVLQFDEPARTLLIGRESGRVEIWNTARGELRHQQQAHGYRVTELAFSEDGESFYSSSGFEDQTLRWSLDGELLDRLPSRGPVAAAPLAGYDLVPVDSSALAFYDHAAKKVLPVAYADVGGVVTVLAGHRGSARVAVGTASGGIRVLQAEVRDGQPTLRLLAQVDAYPVGTWLKALAFSEDGNQLLSVSRAGEVARWSALDLASKQVLPSTLGWVFAASFAADGDWLAMTGTVGADGLRDGKYEVLDLRAGVATRYPANTNLPVAILLPPVREVLVAQSRSIRGRPYPD